MSDEPQTFPVVRLGQEGDGVIVLADGERFVAGALPGERVMFANDRPPVVLETSFSGARRSVPLCPHVARCGGCSVQHMDDDLYRGWKATLLPEALRRLGLDATVVRPMIEVPRMSRRRAVFSVRRDGARVDVGFHAARSQTIEAITRCGVLSPDIVAGVVAVRALGRSLLTSKSEARVSVLDTTAGLDIGFDAARSDLSADGHALVVETARAHRVARVSVGTRVLVTHADPVLSMSGVDVVPPPGAFVQAVADAEVAMVRLAVAGVGKAKRVADLFAGLGPFSLALAAKARVLAVDSDQALTAALEMAHRKAQGLKPIETKVRDLFTDPLSPRELEGIDAVVFDPPRAGARDQARALAKSKVARIIAVSCNPATLARDLEALVEGGYTLNAVTPIDQFLFTAHVEAVAVLSRGRT